MPGAGPTQQGVPLSCSQGSTMRTHKGCNCLALRLLNVYLIAQHWQDRHGGSHDEVVHFSRTQQTVCPRLKLRKMCLAGDDRDDLVALIMESLTNPEYSGVYNGTAPNPVRMSELCSQLGVSCSNRPSLSQTAGFTVCTSPEKLPWSVAANGMTPTVCIIFC